MYICNTHTHRKRARTHLNYDYIEILDPTTVSLTKCKFIHGVDVNLYLSSSCTVFSNVTKADLSVTYKTNKIKINTNSNPVLPPYPPPPQKKKK